MHAVLVSHDGPHSADSWANATAEFIFAINESIAADRLLAAKRLQLGIAMALQHLFEDIIAAECKALHENESHCDSALMVDAFAVEKVLVSIGNMAGSTPWADLVKSEPWVAGAREQIVAFLNDAQHIERLWHADRTDNQSAKAYKAEFHGEIN